MMASDAFLVRDRHRAAFTLVEVSIVLAIIGLLIGGVLAGQYTLRQSQLQSVVTDLAEYKSAFLEFKEEYGGMPGDLLDAVDYWGTDTTGTCPSGTNVPKKETCNGDGDNEVDTIDSGTTYSEWWRAWQHLSNAGLITGTFSGVAGSGGITHAVPGTNVPRGQVSNTGFTMRTLGSVSGVTGLFDGEYGTVIIFGALNSSGYTYTPVLTTREASYIDTKIDDGRPGLGFLRSYNGASGWNTNCPSSSTASSATYLLSTGGVNCSLIYTVDS